VGVELKREEGGLGKEREEGKEGGGGGEDLDTTCSNYHQMVLLQK
jgi:hypothetical protein